MLGTDNIYHGKRITSTEISGAWKKKNSIGNNIVHNNCFRNLHIINISNERYIYHYYDGECVQITNAFASFKLNSVGK